MARFGGPARALLGADHRVFGPIPGPPQYEESGIDGGPNRAVLVGSTHGTSPPGMELL
jgi:hypothetical protein